MIRCGVAMNLNGVWEEHHLSPELHNIVKKCPGNFSGEPVTTEHDSEGAETYLDD